LPKSVNRTLRLDEELDRAIAKKASKDRTSVNFLVNRCIRKFVEWDSPSSEFGVVSVPKSLLDGLVRDKDEEALERYGREVARNLVKPAAEYVLGEFTVESAVEIEEVLPLFREIQLRF
jgi:predicted HicB family RNase H-like nuclease